MAAAAVVEQDGAWVMRLRTRPGLMRQGMTALKAGAATDKRDANGALAIDLAPDAKIRAFILRAAEEDGIDVATS